MVWILEAHTTHNIKSLCIRNIKMNNIYFVKSEIKDHYYKQAQGK